MNRIKILILALWGIAWLGHAAILPVGLDGSQPYSQIQVAIDASAHGDTVLVHPGTYYENIRFNGKNITLASLELTTGDLSYKCNTIINGGENGSVIQIRNGESLATIRSITVTNGSGFYDDLYDETYGGGILIGLLASTNNIRIMNCIITKNRAGSGGGIQASRCNLTLSGVSIRDNNANAGGGLVYASNNAQSYNVTFDPVNRSSIYNNKAANGSDMYFYWVNQVHVVVDTFTVANPWNFYASAVPQDESIGNPYTFDILHTVHTEVNHDLYVAPWGDDANDGLSEGSPLKTIFRAVYNIASDPLNPKTIHVAEGYYSKSLNQQLFAIPVKSYTRLSGVDRERVILDLEGSIQAVFISAYSNDVGVSKLTAINGKGGLSSLYSDNINISDVSIINNESRYSTYGYGGYRNANQSLSNISIINTHSQVSKIGVSSSIRNGTLTMRNIEITNLSGQEFTRGVEIYGIEEAEVDIDGLRVSNVSGFSPEWYNSIFQIAPFDDYGDRMRISISNSAFVDNSQMAGNYLAYAFALNDTLFVSNCTFAGNSGGSTALIVQGNAVFTNNIFWNPQLPTEITAFYSSSQGVAGRLVFDHNCIRNGPGGIYNMSPLNQIIWQSSNLAQDPLFALEGHSPYRLSALSPLIDMGLQPAVMESTLDAGGNERYWDGDGDGLAIIDIGAYEYQPVYSPINLSAQLWQQQILLQWQMPDAPRGLSGYRVYRNGLAYADVFDAALMQFRDYSTVNDTLLYYVVALYGNVESAASNSVTVIISGVETQDEALAPGLQKMSISPNPFRDLAVISYNLGKASEIELSIYNLKGQKVRTLFQGTLPKGEQAMAWDGCDQDGKHVASGVYFCRLSTQDTTLTRKMLVLR